MYGINNLNVNFDKSNSLETVNDLKALSKADSSNYIGGIDKELQERLLGSHGKKTTITEINGKTAVIHRGKQKKFGMPELGSGETYTHYSGRVGDKEFEYDSYTSSSGVMKNEGKRGTYNGVEFDLSYNNGTISGTINGKEVSFSVGDDSIEGSQISDAYIQDILMLIYGDSVEIDEDGELLVSEQKQKGSILDYDPVRL